jgi:hypothetical protein
VIHMLETFEAAENRYRRFLVENGYPPQIIWVRSQNVVFPGKRFVYVKFPIPAENLARARETYESGITQQRGVLFSSLCELEEATCCFVWFPKDRDEAARYLMPADGSLKMSALIDLARVPGRVIRTSLAWKILQLRHGKRTIMRDLQFA